MKINFAPNTAFRAKLIRENVPIEKLSHNTNYKPCFVSVLEIETDKAGDVISLSDSARAWGETSYFAQNIADNAMKIHKSGVLDKNRKIYISTLQNGDFEKLEPTSILGMAETTITKKNKLKIEALQSAPDAMYSKNKKALYKNIGKSIVKSLQKQKENKVISLKSMYSATGFYEKMGFKLIDPAQLLYEWRKFKPKH